jgi:hypothetical protein
MKIKSTVLFLFFSILAFGQSPEKFTYQSIIKNSSGYLLKNQEVGLRISILFNSSNGAEVYSEEHFPTSNSNGLVTVIIGEGLTGDNISNIDWGNGEYFIKVEVDPEGGINYTMNQTSQLLSVPYALYAENSGSGLNLLGQDFITLSNQTLTVNKVDLADDVDGILPITNGGTGSDTAPMVGVITAADEAAARSVLGLGTAATTASTDYATAAQGALADTALQDATAFATAAQGAKADTALQAANNLSDLADAATSRTNLGLGTAATTASTDYATAAQGAKADTALQAANNLSDLADAATSRTNLGLGTAATTASTDYATAAQGALADTALQATNNLSDLANAAAARTALGVDASGTDNSTNVTLATVTDNYLSLSNQEITAGTIPVSLGGTGSTTAPMVGVITAANAAAARTALGVDASGTDNSTNVTLANTNYLSISGQEITGGTVPLSSGGTGATTAAAARTALGVDASGTDNSTNVTLATVTDNYLSLSNQEITAGTIPVSLGGTGSTTAPMVGVITAANAAAARTALGVDASGTDNSTNVTLANTNYLSISGQEITGGTVPLSSGGTGATTAAAARTALGVDASGTDNSTNVTLATVTDNYLSLSNQEITAGTIPVSLGGTGSTTAPMVGVITAANAAAARTALGVDASGTDNSTNVTLANTNYLSISGQEITGGTVPLSSGGTGATTAAAARTALGVDASGTDNSTNVTLATVTDNYLSLSNQEITAGTIPVSLGGTGSTTAPMVGVITAANAAAARTALGVDASGTDNSTNVTLATVTDNYLSLSNQEITAGTIPVSLGGTGSTTAPMVGVITAANAAAARTALGVDASGTDNSTNVTLATVTDNYLSLSNQEITAGTIPVSLGGTGSTTAPMVGVITAANAAAARTALGVDASGTDNSTNVTLATVTDNYLSLSNQEITAGTIPVSLGGTGSTTAPMVGVITAANAAAARTALGVDASGTDNSTNVTLANTNYLSISGQEITGGTVPLSSGGTGATTAAAARTALGLSSLSIGASSGAGAVDINSEQLRIVGTLNEIETSATNQTIQVSLPSYIYVNLVGDVQGDVIGSLSGSQVSVNKIINPAQTVSTAGGTITLNGMSGRFRISALSTSATINNDIISSNSVLICTISSANSNDYFISSAVPNGSSGSGSFTVTLDQIPAYDVDINFFIMN